MFLFFFFQVIFSGWIQVDNTNTKTKRSQTMLQCLIAICVLWTPWNFKAQPKPFQPYPTMMKGQQWKFWTPQNFRSVFFLGWFQYGLVILIGSHLLIHLQVTALAAEKRVRRKRKVRFWQSQREGMGCQESWYIVLTLKKEWFFFNRSISEYFVFFFWRVFLLPFFVVLFFFVLMDAFGSYLKKEGSLVLVCQVDGVPGVQWISSTVPGAHCQIREENQRGKTRVSWFLQKRGQNSLDFFLAWFFLGPLNTQTLLTRSFFLAKFVWQSFLCGRTFVSDSWHSLFLSSCAYFSMLRKGILARDLAGALKVSDEEMGDGYPSSFFCSQRLKLPKHDIAPENRAKTCPKWKEAEGCLSKQLSFRGRFLFVSGRVFASKSLMGARRTSASAEKSGGKESRRTAENKREKVKGDEKKIEFRWHEKSWDSSKKRSQIF